MELRVSGIVIGFFASALIATMLTVLLIWSKHLRHHASARLDWVEASFVALVMTVILTGWIGVLLVSFGLFSLAAIGGILWLVVTGLLWWQRPFARPHFQQPDKVSLLLLVLLVGSGIVYFRPHEYVLGGIDPGGYMNIAVTAVRTGDFIVTDEWTAELREFADTTLRQQPAVWRTKYLQFVGWYIDDQHPERTIPQFFPFHPMLVAIGISLGGLMGGLLVTPVWGTLSLAALFLLGRRLFNQYIGLLAALFLALTPTHIYFARYPTTEPLTLLLVFTGLLAFQALWDDAEPARLWGVLGGATFGAAFLTRIDLPLVAGLLFLFFVLRWWQRRWSAGWTAAAIMLSILTVHAALSALLLNWPYTWNTYGSIARILAQSSLVVAVGVLGVLGLMAAVLMMRRMTWVQFKASRYGRLLQSNPFRWSLVGIVILLSLFAYFVRPILQPPGIYSVWPVGSEAYVLDGENWVRLGWYVTPVGLALATAGLAVLLKRYSLNQLGLFLAIGMATIVQYVYRIFNTAYHIYAMRRYVPIVIPMLVLYTAVAIWAIFHWRPRWWPAQVTGGILIVGMCAGLVYQSRAVLPLRDLRGAVDYLTTLHEQIDPAAIILISEPETMTFADTIGPPLRFIYDHDIATIRQEGEAANPFIDWLIAYAEAEERPLQLVATAAIAPIVRERFQLQPAAFVPVRLPKLLSTFTEYPTTMQTVYYGTEIYNLLPKDSPMTESAQTTVTIDIGTLDTAYIVDGFYAKEPLPGPDTMRWTDDRALLDVPDMAGEQFVIEVRARIFRPEGVAETPVTLWVDDEQVGQFTPAREWAVYTFTVTSDSDGVVRTLLFDAETFNPAALQVNNDKRDLGFLMDWVTIEAE
ncbi:MAG: glycosyltransferase family 39 protein [Anaerolineales bacterium]|nr:glycosyltransferase family 39 protein [Anaerolineales bacterium]